MTLLRWMKDPEFRAAYEDAKLRLLRAATARLTKNAAAAAATLAEISEGRPEAHQGSRVAAATATLRLRPRRVRVGKYRGTNPEVGGAKP